MNKISKTTEILKQDGLKALISRGIQYIHWRLGSKGGISSNPRLEQYSGYLRPVYNTIFQYRHGKGTDIMKESWDNLIILDACRYDDFRDLNPLSGELEYRISRAADSSEFIQKNFCDRDLRDTVYITANPHVKHVSGDVFHKIVDDPLSQWDPEVGCVKPSSVTEAALNAHSEFPNKRLIIHYMQPHDPPIGETGELIKDEINLAGTSNHTGPSKEGTRMMTAVRDGKIPVDMARKSYRENLSIVLEEVKILLDEINGRTVISSDHGEMFGEKPYPIIGRLYEHYRHPHTIELCKVPWFIIEADRRRSIHKSDNISSDKRVEDNQIEDQLKALGYK